MNNLLVEQFSRLLDVLDPKDPWPTLAESGFLDVLRSEADGGAGLGLSELFPLAIETGRRFQVPPVIETMLSRIRSAEALDVPDAEAALNKAGVCPLAARSLAAAAAAGLMAGAAERILELTLDYASMRHQFGRPIGKFQAVQHQLAVMAEEVQGAHMAAQAAFVGAPLEIAPHSAAVAKMVTGQAAQVVSSLAHAVHGAIGISQEYPLHSLTRRLHRLRQAHGGETYWASRLGVWALSGTSDFVTLARSL